MSDKTMYTITDFPEVARDLTRKNMAILYRTSAHHDQIEKGINYGEAITAMKKQRDPDNIEKSGEGSKGGKVIGHTTSGKPVYAKNGADHESYKDFTPKEHHEAAVHHNTEQMTVLEGGKSKHGPKGQAHHEAMEVAHNKMATQKKKEAGGKSKSDKLAAEKKEWDEGQSSLKDRHKKESGDAHDAFHSEYGAAKNNEHAAEIFNKHKKLQDDMVSRHDRETKDHWDKYKDEWAGKEEIKKAEELLIGVCIEMMIQKGEISDTLGRGYGPASEPIKFVKTGKELKEKIPTIITALTLEIGKAEGMMTEIQKEIGLEPNEPRNSYSMKNISIMSYNWDLCNPVYDKVQQSYPAPSDQNLLCSKYNSLGYMVISMQEDVATLNVMQGNLEDGKKYTLSVSQLIALGF